MSDKSENCPVCLKELKVHAIQNFIDCIQVLINQNKDDSNPTSFDKNREGIRMVNDQIELTNKKIKVCKTTIRSFSNESVSSENKLAIEYLERQKQLLKKLREILV